LPQLINLFLVIFGVICAGTGLAGWRSHPLTAWLPLAVGVAAVTLAYFSDRHRERRKQARERAAVRRSVDELARRPWQAGASLKVYGAARHVLLGVLVTAVGAGIVYVGAIEAKLDAMPFIGGVVLLSGLLVLSRALPGLGHPVIELTATDFITPLNGPIAWCHVSGICLHEVTGRGGAKNYWLKFRVKQFARVAPRIHWTDHLLAVCRLGALAKGVVSGGLPGSTPPPEAVRAAARQLWKQATGHDYEWNPLMSEEYNEAMKRIGEFSATAGEAVLADPLQASRCMDRLDRDMQLLTHEQRRLQARQRRGAAVLVVVMLLLVAWPWVRALLRH